MRFTSFFVYSGDCICPNKSIIFGGIKIWQIKSSHFLYYSETEKKLHLSLRLLGLQSAAKHTAMVANVNKCTETILPDHNGTMSLTAVLWYSSALPIVVGQTGSSAIRSANPENPTLEPNMEWSDEQLLKYRHSKFSQWEVGRWSVVSIKGCRRGKTVVMMTSKVMGKRKFWPSV